MLRAVIADDEHRVLKLLRNLIDWEAMGVRIIAEATDGMEAFQLTAKFKPDVLITDIRLPIMTGLDVAKKIHSLVPDVSIIIISGHKHFEYAHAAFKHGVVDYLVKPVDSSDLITALDKVKEQKDHSDRLRIGLRNQAIVNDLFFDDCIHYKTTVTSVDELNREYQFDFQHDQFTVFVHYFTVEGDTESHERLFNKLKNLYVGFFRDIDVATVYQETQYGLLGVANYPEEAKTELYGAMESSYERMSVELDIWANLQSTIVVSDPITSVVEFPTHTRRTLNALFSKCVQNYSRTVYVSDFHWDDDPELLVETDRIQLVKILERFSTADLAQWVRDKFRESRDVIQSKPWTAYLLATSIQTFCRSILPVDQDGAGDTQRSRSLLTAESLDELIRNLVGDLNHRIELKYSEKKNKDSQPIMLSKTFMTKHLAEQISIEHVASAVGLSYAYFSNLFKSETGITAGQFLLDTRLEKAKEYLRNSSYNLSEIALKVGYTDPKHFSRVFSKNVGVKAKDYRRLYS